MSYDRKNIVKLAILIMTIHFGVSPYETLKYCPSIVVYELLYLTIVAIN